MAERRSPAAGFAAGFEAASAGGQLCLAEIPFLTQINLRVDPESHAAERIGLALGAPLPVEPGSAVRSGDLTVLWLGPDEWLVIGPDEAADVVATGSTVGTGSGVGAGSGVGKGRGGVGLRDRLAEAAAGSAADSGQAHPGSAQSGQASGHVSVVDVSAQRTTLLVGGARARDLLAHGCAIDLHPRAFGRDRCAQTLLARAQVVLVARETDEFWVLCRSSFAGYVADWLLDAATEYVT